MLYESNSSCMYITVLFCSANRCMLYVLPALCTIWIIIQPIIMVSFASRCVQSHLINVIEDTDICFINNQSLPNPIRHGFHTGYGMFSLWFNELWVIVHWITMKTCHLSMKKPAVRDSASFVIGHFIRSTPYQLLISTLQILSDRTLYMFQDFFDRGLTI